MTKKPTYIWKLKITLLNNSWIKGKIAVKLGIRRYF